MAVSVDSESRSNGALPACLGNENPNRLVSLWEIVFTIHADEIVSVWPQLAGLQIGYLNSREDPDVVTTEEARDVLRATAVLCRKLKWRDLANQAGRLLDRAEGGEYGVVMSELASDLNSGFQSAVKGVRLLVIDEGDIGLFEDATAHLCGIPLHGDLAIPEEELNLAGRALAAGLSTACVSHSMRSVESSLHVLGRTLAISFAAPIELQEWTNLTEKIQREIREWETKTKSTAKTEQLKLLSKLILDADHFRLAWRNHVAHAREKYEDPEARKVIRFVAEFLSDLTAAL